jgi:hypothetical protein
MSDGESRESDLATTEYCMGNCRWSGGVLEQLWEVQIRHTGDNIVLETKQEWRQIPDILKP